MTSFQYDGFPEKWDDLPPKEEGGLTFKVIVEEGPGGGLPVTEVSGPRPAVVRFAILMSFTRREIRTTPPEGIMDEVSLYVEDISLEEIKEAIASL